MDRINDLEEKIASLIEERDAWAFSANSYLRLYDETKERLHASDKERLRLECEVHRLEQLLSGR